MKIITRHIETWTIDDAPEDLVEKIVEKHYDINVDFEWWDFVYEDAENVHLKITEFDLGRESYCKAEFMESAEETANAILRDHGESCQTYSTALEYLQDRKSLVAKYSDGADTSEVAEDNEYEFDKECDGLDAEFLQAIGEDYRIILDKEYEYLTSEEAIIETLRANEYDFDINGDIVS